MAVAAFREVRLSRGGRAVLAGATWTLEAGAFHLLTGPSGCGKSAWLALCALRLRPEAGEVSLFGAPATGVAGEAAAGLRRRIGWAPQVPEFLEHMSLAENVALPLRLAGRPPALRLAQARELLDWIGLGARAGDPPGALSAGERRRAALARAVIAGPELILADEPAGDLDPEGAERALQVLAALASHGAAVLAVTQSAEFARLARHRAEARVLRLEDGRPVGAAAA